MAITALMADTIERVRQNYVYDAGLLAWVPMTQPTGGTGGTASAFNAAFPADGTAVGFLNSAGTLMVPLQLTAAGKVPVDATFSGGAVDQGAPGASAWPVAAALDTSTIYNGATPLTPKFQPLAASTTGATVQVAGVLGKTIRVLGLIAIANGTVTANLQSHTTTAKATGLFYLAANTGFASGFWPIGFFETIAGEGLDLNLTGNVAVGGQLVYVEL